MNLNEHKTLLSQIAAWSDAHLAEARTFVESHEHLLSRDFTTSQLYGLSNIARNAIRYNDVSKFMRHQADKAERANTPGMADCWRGLQSKLNAYHDDAVKIAREIKQQWAGDESQVDKIHLQLVQRFVQHLIAESLVYPQTNMHSRKKLMK